MQREAIAGDGRPLNHVGGFGHDRARRRAFAGAEVEGDHAPPGRVEIGEDVEYVAHRPHRGVSRLAAREERNEGSREIGRLWILQVHHVHPGGGPLLLHQERPSPVVAQHAVQVAGVLPLVDQPVLLLRRAERVIEVLFLEPRGGGVLARRRRPRAPVEETVTVEGPADRSPRIAHHVALLASRGEVAHVRIAARAAGRLRVREPASVGRHRIVAHGDRSVRRDVLGVEDDARRVARAVHRVEERLRLRAAVLGEEQPAGFAPWHVGPAEAPQPREPLPDPLPRGKAREVVLGQATLHGHPVHRGGAVEPLEPAIGIGDRRAEERIHDAVAMSGRVSERLRRRAHRPDGGCERRELHEGHRAKGHSPLLFGNFTGVEVPCRFGP